MQTAEQCLMPLLRTVDPGGQGLSDPLRDGVTRLPQSFHSARTFHNEPPKALSRVNKQEVRKPGTGTSVTATRPLRPGHKDNLQNGCPRSALTLSVLRRFIPRGRATDNQRGVTLPVLQPRASWSPW